MARAVLVQTLGRVPHVRLGGTDLGSGARSPVGMPDPADSDRLERLQLFGAIGRRGMGVVLKLPEPDRLGGKALWAEVSSLLQP
jgi:hypothetical protein